MVGAVIVAGGKGVRMQNATPKQYIALAGLPVICHALRRFSDSGAVDAIVLVVPESDFDRCRHEILPAAGIDLPVRLAGGGRHRQDSVANGITAMGDGRHDDLLVIHDGARPLVAPADIAACVHTARATGACILGEKVTDTLKQVATAHRITATIDRRDVWCAQTPQVFRRDIILAAHAAARDQNRAATDDCALVEALGIPVSIIAASAPNIKITTPADLALAQALLNAARPS